MAMNVCMFVCSLSPLPFMGRSGPNLAGTSGTGVESSLRHWFPWQPTCCHGNQQMWFFMARSQLLFDVTLAMTSGWRHKWCHIANGIMGDVTMTIASWKHHSKSALVSRIQRGRALFWTNLQLKTLDFCQFSRWESGWEPHWQCASIFNNIYPFLIFSKYF